MNLHNPSLEPVEIGDLRPTQISLGMREVEERREQWRERAKKDLRANKDPEVFLARPRRGAPDDARYLPGWCGADAIK